MMAEVFAPLHRAGVFSPFHFLMCCQSSFVSSLIFMLCSDLLLPSFTEKMIVLRLAAAPPPLRRRRENGFDTHI